MDQCEGQSAVGSGAVGRKSRRPPSEGLSARTASPGPAHCQPPTANSAGSLIHLMPDGVVEGHGEDVNVGELQRLADEDLMPLVERKDPNAFEILYDRHGGPAYSLAYRIVGDRAAAEDVTQ